jgi:hypothetical protein
MSKEARRFVDVMNEKAASKIGKSVRVHRSTTAQRSNEEGAAVDILRGKITWGTPIIRNP